MNLELLDQRENWIKIGLQAFLMIKAGYCRMKSIYVVVGGDRCAQ